MQRNAQNIVKLKEIYNNIIQPNQDAVNDNS